MSDATLPQSPSDKSAVKHAARYATYFFWVMFFANFVNYLQRFIFSGLSVPITHDLKLNDEAFGLLGTIFFLVYTIFALPLGFLADRIGRKAIVGVGMALASVATILTGLAPTFPLLVGVKSLFGLGQSGFYPAGTPFLTAQFPPSQRARVIGRWTVGSLIGAGLGFLAASYFDESTWRTGLLIAGIPGILVAVFVLILREKRRHEDDPAPAVETSASGPSVWSRLRSYLSIPTFRVIVGMHAFGFFAITGIAFWLPLYLGNTYGQTVRQFNSSGLVTSTEPSHFGAAGLSQGLIPVLAGGVVLIGGILGNLYGSRLATRLSRRSPNARVLAGGVGFLLTAPCVLVTVGAPYLLSSLPFYAGLDMATQVQIGIVVFLVFGLLASFFLNIYNGPTSAALLDVIPADERGSAGGAELFLAHLLGDAFSPLIIGAISVALTVQLGGEQVGLALLSTTPIALIFAGIIGIWGSRFYASDVAKQGTTAEEVLGIPTPA